MEFKEVLASRRSCRAFKSDPIPAVQIDELIKACQWAPNPLNLQPWRFIVITKPEVKSEVKAAAEEAREAILAQEGPGWVAKYGFDFLEQAPVLLVVLSQPAKGGLGGFFNQPHGALQAASAGIQNVMLAAAEMGLGSLWFTFFDPQKMRAVLGVPDDLDIAGIIPLGAPQDWPEAPPRKPAQVFYQRYEKKG